MKNPKCEEVVKGNIEPLTTPPINDKKRYRAYCLTSFCSEPPALCEEVQFLCYSKEICPSTGRNHWQGYLFFKSKDGYNIKRAQEILGGSYTIIPAKGTPQENCDYCGETDYVKNGKVKVKNPTFVKLGIMPQQGKRNDLNDLKDEILNGVKVNDIVLRDPVKYHQYGRTLHKIEDIYLSKKVRTEMPKVIWYYGKTGVGKSHTVFKDFDPETCYEFNVNDGGFWEDYTGQETIIINEFRGEIKFQELLKICDKYPYKCKRKGRGPCPLLAKKILITSCKRPEDIYKHSLDEEDSIDQFLRRVEIIELKKVYKKD